MSGKQIWDDLEKRNEYVDSKLWAQEIFKEKFYDLSYEELPKDIKWLIDLYAPKHGAKKGFSVIETTLSDNIQVWGYEDVTHTPMLSEIHLGQDGEWKIGDKVRVTIELMEENESQ